MKELGMFEEVRMTFESRSEYSFRFEMLETAITIYLDPTKKGSTEWENARSWIFGGNGHPFSFDALWELFPAFERYDIEAVKRELKKKGEGNGKDDSIDDERKASPRVRDGNKRGFRCFIQDPWIQSILF